MKESIEKKGDTALRRKAFELYARALACREEGEELAREMQSYAQQALLLLERLEVPGAEDGYLESRLKEL